MITILIFIVLLGILVFVHELGHFMVAKRNGIKSEEFGFGFPPRMAGVYRDDRTKTWRFVLGKKEMALGELLKVFSGTRVGGWKPLQKASERKNTVYSLNWIPLGGFVKIKGEETTFSSDPDSFANRPAWTRIKVLGAGVFMNFLLAWVLFSIVFMIGIPQAIDPSELGRYPDTAIRVTEVKSGTPAESMGLKPGDEIRKINGREIEGKETLGDIIGAQAGKTVQLEVDRFGEKLELQGTPRQNPEPSEGSLGFAYAYTALKSFPWYEAIGQGALATYKITAAILEAFGKMIAYLFGGEKVPVDVTGPVGIVYLTKQMNDLGLAYLLQFAALLSLNLAIINILPIPAPDGGRILFILIEKLKGRPVSERVEGMIHQTGFILLLFLMAFITLRDFAVYNVWERLSRFF